MHVDDHIVNTEFAQACERDLEEGSAGDLDQRLGPIVGQWAQACAKSCRQDHGLHFPRVSRLIWRRATSTPDFPLRCLASSSAKKTDRCCPPVQPNETMRLLNPRRWYPVTLASTSDMTFA